MYNISEAQWLQEVRLTNDPGISYASYNNARPIAANGDTIHVFFSDNRDGNDEIYYKRSTDNGNTWGNDIRLTNASNLSWCPSAAVSGSFVHLVWHDSRDGNEEIYYKRSTDAGLSWGTDIRLTNSTGYSGTPCLAISDSILHVVWEDKRDGNSEIYYKRSRDAGMSWESDIRLTNAIGISEIPSVSVSGNDVHVAWDDNRDLNYEIYYKRSTDGGLSWDSDIRLTENVLSSFFTCITSSENFVHIVWIDTRFGNDEILYKRSIDGGNTWSIDTRLTNASGTSEYPNIIANGSFLHLVWDDDRNPDYEIYYKRSVNNGNNWEPDVRLTNYKSLLKDFPAVAVSRSTVHIVWEETRQGDGWEIYYKKNPSGNTVNIENISSEIPGEFLLWQNFPNPFNPVTNIKFQILKSEFVSVKVYDITGKKLIDLVNQKLSPGSYQVQWNAENYPSGIYWYSLESASFRETKKMILLK